MTLFKKRPHILFLAPSFLLYSMFYIYPVLSSIPYSFTKWSGLGKPVFVGLNNYITLFNNPILVSQIRNAFFNNILLLIGALIFLTPFIIFLAYSIYKRIPLTNFFKVTIFLPYFINTVAIGFLATLLVDPNIGIISIIENFLKIKIIPQDIFSNRLYTIPYVLIVSTWNSVGYCMIIVLASFNLVPYSLIEAALIDGANEWTCFTKVYFPLIRPAFVNILVLNFVWSISIFDIPFILGGLNGGVGYKMDFISLFYYRISFSSSYIENARGMGTTLAVMISVIAMGGSLIIMRLLRSRDIDVY